MKHSFFQERILRRRYIVNLKSKTIHRIDKDGDRCMTEYIQEGKYVSYKRVTQLLAGWYNACRKCMPK